MYLKIRRHAVAFGDIEARLQDHRPRSPAYPCIEDRTDIESHTTRLLEPLAVDLAGYPGSDQDQGSSREIELRPDVAKPIGNMFPWSRNHDVFVGHDHGACPHIESARHELAELWSRSDKPYLIHFIKDPVQGSCCQQLPMDPGAAELLIL